MTIIKTMSSIKYPFLPAGRIIEYVAENDPFMAEAKEFSCRHSLDDKQKTGSVLVKDNVIIGRGANGSKYHINNICERVKRNIPTGKGYDLCEGCHPNNHSESKSILNAKKTGLDISGADLYLWGHWWCCQPCWNVMNASGIRNVYLLEKSEILFNRESKENILGHQCQ